MELWFRGGGVGSTLPPDRRGTRNGSREDIRSGVWLYDYSARTPSEQGKRIREMIRRICVFCGSSDGARPEYLDAATELGKQLAARNIGLVYGGAGVGLMGAVADAVLARAARSLASCRAAWWSARWRIASSATCA